MRRLTNGQARRYALGAQGFAASRPQGRVDVRHHRKVLGGLGAVQLDSVNVFARAHYLPFFSRLGAYDRDRLDRWIWSSGEVCEYWAHMASVIPASAHRLFRWRMQRTGVWKRLEKVLKEEPDYLERVLDQVRERGPLRTSDLDDPGAEPGGGMWSWSDGKMALEHLFVKGTVTTAARPNFTRLYDLTERVIPAEHLDAPTPREDAALSELLLRSARSLGVATASDLADYYRLTSPPGAGPSWSPKIPPLLERLVATGHLEQVVVEGWDKPAYLHPEARLPREVPGAALLSPFDSLVFYRDRVERLWDFHYRIEIYTPRRRRVYGYYVLPFLLDGDLVGRVDLKADRASGTLRVKGAFAEAGVDRIAVGRALRQELELAAAWLGMDDIVIDDNGDLATHL